MMRESNHLKMVIYQNDLLTEYYKDLMLTYSMCEIDTLLASAISRHLEKCGVFNTDSNDHLKNTKSMAVPTNVLDSVVGCINWRLLDRHSTFKVIVKGPHTIAIRDINYADNS